MSLQNHNHIIILTPTDVLFFRDGRPLEAGHHGKTQAWPLPDIVDHAFHAALHRAGLDNVHKHRREECSGKYTNDRNQKFGCLQTAGPFPVHETAEGEKWYFPTPKDILIDGTVTLSAKPLPENTRGVPKGWVSSLPSPLKYLLATTTPPEKHLQLPAWISAEGYKEYIAGNLSALKPEHFLHDQDIAETEPTIGIAINPATSTVREGMIYSAFTLRLKEGFHLGVIAKALDKGDGKANDTVDGPKRIDLIALLLNDHPQTILVGGQQRACTARRRTEQRLPLPLGRSQFTPLPNGKVPLKWILLTPAIWPEIKPNTPEIQPHPGGWLPNWISPEDGSVSLKKGDTERKVGESRIEWRKRVKELPRIQARLVAALVPRPLVVTGWALPKSDEGSKGGAKSTHLAVPPGAVYYFEAENLEEAQHLAQALNWHGDTEGTEIKNRRSTLLGEKGYGLGVCTSWDFYTVNPSQGETL